MDKLLENHHFATHAVAASASVSLGTALAYTLETIKTIMNSGNPPSAMDVKRPLDVASLEGVRALWRNLRSGLIRDCLYGGVFFGTWQFLPEAMIGWKAVGTNPLPSSEEEVGPLSPVAISIAAGFSGAIAAAASHSFDTARTRAQCVILPKFGFCWIGTRMARICVASTVIVGCYYLAVDLFVPK
ncbi:hypothetical protein F2Q69_00034655 [Brassica cretica]|uniref:Uncharacterized protein n=1 Tax=Brassica cretica TaxID=69181 RepID=A0A8S9SLF8_BRACR|nr:hypothetical protein F2Q69_00034655 [Brassica cretica]